MIEYNRALPLPAWFKRSEMADVLNYFVGLVNEQPQNDKKFERAWLDMYGIVGLWPSESWLRTIISGGTPCFSKRIGCFQPIKDEHLLEAVRSDSISMFNLYQSLGHFKMTATVLRQLLMSDEGFNVTMYALETYERLVGKIPKWRLFTYLSANCMNERKCLEVTNFLTERGLNLSGEVDSLGLTPLSYTLFARRGEFLGADRPCEYEKFLMKRGCDPYRKDVFGLSYDQISKAFYR